MALRIPLVIINGRKMELPTEDQIPTSCVGTYVYHTSTPLTIWEINHNMNKNPSVSVVDEFGSTIYPKIVYINMNSIEIHFSKPTAGKAYLN